MCYSGAAREPSNNIVAVLHDLSRFKDAIDNPVGQEARIVIKRSLQKVDQEWIITLLRKMKEKQICRKIVNPWCAFESAFAEPPFEVFTMRVEQVAMLYYTMKDHLSRHVPTLASRPSGSLWDFVPGVHDTSKQWCLIPKMTRCLYYGQSDWMEEKAREIAEPKEEEISNSENEEANSQWVEQMMKASDAPMPFKHKVANAIVALLATTLAILASYEPTAADSVTPQLQ